MSRSYSFKKVKVKGAIDLGSQHELVQVPKKSSKNDTTYMNIGGLDGAVEIWQGKDDLGQLMEFKFSEEVGALNIKDSGLTTSFGIFGAPGSGKTVLMMYLLEQILNMNKVHPDKKYGALILDPKASLIDDVKDIVKRAGREKDLVILNSMFLSKSGQSVNVIDCTLDPYELGAILVLAGQSAGVGASDPFWFQEWSNLFSASLSILRTVRAKEPCHDSTKTVTLKDLLDAVLGEVQKGETDRKKKIQVIVEDLAERIGEYSLEEQNDLQNDIQIIKRFYQSDYVATVEAFIYRSYGIFRRHRQFCFSGKQSYNTSVPFYEDIIENGRIVLVSVSPSEPALAKTLSTMVKCLFQRTVLARGDLANNGIIQNTERPLVMACDEYSEIASEIPGQSMGDGQFLALARQYGCMALLATQSVNVLEASSLREVWRSVFSNFAAKIFMRLADNETAEEATKMAGESDWKMYSQGESYDGSASRLNRNRDVRERKNLQTTVLTQGLRTGEGVVIGSLDGGMTRPGTYFLKVPHPDEQLRRIYS